MSDERSVQILFHAHESSEKFDYFICGVTGALFAYVGQNFVPVRLGFNLSLFEPLALVFLVIAFFIGLLRIETDVTMKMENARMLDSHEKAGACSEVLMNAGRGYVVSGGSMIGAAQAAQAQKIFQAKADQLEKTIEKLSRKSQFLYQVRNGFLIGGFVALLAARILKAYA